MAQQLDELKSVAKAIRNLHVEINKLRKAGEDEKTDALEKKILRLISRLEAAAEQAANSGQGSSDELIELLEGEEAALKAYLNQPGGLPFAERINTRSHLQEVQFKLGALKIGKTLTWDSLLSTQELNQLKDDLKVAAQEVRRRRKLQTVINSVFNVGILAIGLTTRIATRFV